MYSKTENVLICCHVYSLFQLVQGLAFIHYQIEQGKSVRGVICFENYWKNIELPKRYIDVASQLRSEFVESKRFYEFLDNDEANSYTYFLSADRHIQYPWNKIKKVRIDDGIGSYRSNALELVNIKQEESGFKYSKSYIYIYIVKFYLRFIASFLFRPTYFSMMERNTLRITTNRLARKHICHIMELLGKSYKKEFHIEQESDIFLLPAVTREIHKSDLRKAEIALQKIRNIAKNLVIIPHPADLSTALPLSINESEVKHIDGIVEEFFWANKKYIKSVFGNTSTALWTGRLFFDLNTVSVDMETNDWNVKRIFLVLTSKM